MFKSSIFTRKPITDDRLLFPCGMSRSGTTLLTTIFDSHSQISLGYELIPPKLPGPTVLKKSMEEGLRRTNGDFEKCGKAVASSGQKEIGLFLTRCFRAGISEVELGNIFQDMVSQGKKEISSLEERLGVAWRIARQKKISENTQVYGFKLNMPSFEDAYGCFPGGYFVYIVRDPRDVVASQIKRGFERTAEEICIAWNKYIKSFEKFHASHSEQSMIIRYEDLVSRSYEIITKIFTNLHLEPEEEVFQFYHSKASIHRSSHPNSANLKRDFFTTSIGRWKEELDKDTRDLILENCKERMRNYAYEQE